jgi:hypothetical protein
MDSKEKKIGRFGMIFFFADIILFFVVMSVLETFHNVLPDFLALALYFILAPGSLLGFFLPEDFSFMILPMIISPIIWLIIGMKVDKIIERKKELKD